MKLNAWFDVMGLKRTVIKGSGSEWIQLSKEILYIFFNVVCYWVFRICFYMYFPTLLKFYALNRHTLVSTSTGFSWRCAQGWSGEEKVPELK